MNDEPVTLLRPGFTPGAGRSSTGALPPDLLAQAARRLRTVALVYSFTYFMVDIFPALLTATGRGLHFASPMQWAPGVVAIALGLLVAAIASAPQVPITAVMTLGLVFEVVGGYGIVAGELATPIGGVEVSGRFHGLSWVAAWTLVFTIVMPTPPRRALAAALLSASAVPVTVGVLIAMGRAPDPAPLGPAEFFFGFVSPYLLIVLMAWVGARVVYGLGAEVSRARELGSYRLEEKLGQGGMGEVWRARHRLLARPAAIKLIRPSVMASGRRGAMEGAVRRFEREAQAIAGLRSPHTVNLFDFGVATDGTFYYVMELLEGLDAERLVRQHGPMPPGRAIHLLRQVCHSISEAEAGRLVHRDLKPANIFVCRYGEEYDFVKVLDFGIVRGPRDGTDPAEPLSGDHAVQGTPAYISPEQAMGRPVDSRADIYSIGCVAYWLLTGETVFTSGTAMGLLVDHAKTPPAPPSTRTDREIPADLEEVVLACLAKDPADRPPTARELSRRLGEVVAGDRWSQDRAREWWERHQPAGA
ncbi:MAG TPA: serine/threonine-protein kinase [Gemmatimonadales bacterium]|nr:serine/threonine-protein kinase [Gemmatimonadales bacterium]